MSAPSAAPLPDDPVSRKKTAERAQHAESPRGPTKATRKAVQSSAPSSPPPQAEGAENPPEDAASDSPQIAWLRSFDEQFGQFYGEVKLSGTMSIVFKRLQQQLRDLVSVGSATLRDAPSIAPAGLIIALLEQGSRNPTDRDALTTQLWAASGLTTVPAPVFQREFMTPGTYRIFSPVVVAVISEARGLVSTTIKEEALTSRHVVAALLKWGAPPVTPQALASVGIQMPRLASAFLGYLTTSRTVREIDRSGSWDGIIRELQSLYGISLPTTGSTAESASKPQEITPIRPPPAPTVPPPSTEPRRPSFPRPKEIQARIPAQEGASDDLVAPGDIRSCSILIQRHRLSISVSGALWQAFVDCAWARRGDISKSITPQVLFLALLETGFGDRGREKNPLLYDITRRLKLDADGIRQLGRRILTQSDRHAVTGIAPSPATTALLVDAQALCGETSKDGWLAARHIVAVILAHATREHLTEPWDLANDIDSKAIGAALFQHLTDHSGQDRPGTWERELKKRRIDRLVYPATHFPPAPSGPPGSNPSATPSKPSGPPGSKPSGPPGSTPTATPPQTRSGPPGSSPTPPVSEFLDGPAGYSSEFCGVGSARHVDDHLGVEGLAHRLADLVALRETRLPLAIGLFGDWGSGKSHFMNLMDRRLKKRADDEKAKPTGLWCGEIVPIYFNAWHYLDSNLWASLVSHIFDSLFAYLRPKQDELAKVQALLENAAGATARAAEDVALAHTATVKAEEDLRRAETDRRAEETIVHGLLHGLKALLPDEDHAKLQARAVELLDARKEVETLKDLEELVTQAQSLRTRTLAAGRAVLKPDGRAFRLGCLLAVIAGCGFGLPWLVAAWPALEALLSPVAGWVKQTIAWVGGLGLALAPFIKQAHEGLAQFEAWRKKAAEAQARARETPEVIEAKRNQVAAKALEEAAKVKLAAAKAREKQLEEEARNLSPERKLSRFIERRAESADYRGQLSLVSLARRDFQELSDIFADAGALKARLQQLNETGEAAKIAEAENLNELSKSIDRIVLFIDDLDRCQPEKVVQVLEAVHLLLAFPLFAVVVGVDQRCLRQSLRTMFKGLLTPETDPQAAQAVHPANERDERPATPLDYLEKIFHVPFHLPPMGKPGFGMLMDKLSAPTPPPAPAPVTTPAPLVPPAPPANAPAAGSAGAVLLSKFIPNLPDPHAATLTGLPPAPVTSGPQAAPPVTPALPGKGNLPPPPPSLPPPPAPAPKPVIKTPSGPALVGSVPLQEWERTALRDYHPLIRTPRGATRLLNTYRLVRAGVPETEWPAFRDDGTGRGEFRIAMLLLACAAGYPAVARDWFELLRTLSPSEWPGEEDPRVREDRAWMEFKKLHLATVGNGSNDDAKKNLHKWLDRVERFAF